MRLFWRDVFSQQPGISWQTARDFLLISTGAIIQALALRLFLVPANLASGGISGLAQIINYYTGFPIGVMVLLGNIPLFFSRLALFRWTPICYPNSLCCNCLFNIC